MGGLDDSSAALPLVGSHSQGFEAPDRYGYDDAKAYGSDDGYDKSRFTSQYGDTESLARSESLATGANMFNGARKTYTEKEVLPGEEPLESETVEPLPKTSGSRLRWLTLVWLLTFWFPSPFLTWFGRMKRKDVRMAWREKLAINLIIWGICGTAIFIVLILGNLICPTQFVYTPGELAQASFANNPAGALVAIRGEVFNLAKFAPSHLATVGVVPLTAVLKYGGLDASKWTRPGRPT